VSTGSPIITGMMKTLDFDLPPYDEQSLDDCQAALLCLSTRQFVVVRFDEPRNLWPIDGGWEKIRDLQPGDDVVYKGRRATVLALEVYR
jgi:hypothetical protein